MFRISRKVDFGIACSPTEETTQMYRKHMADACIFDGFSPAKLEQMLTMQRHALQLGKALRSLYFICDDCTYDKTIFKGKAVRDLFMNGRHVNISYLNCMQYVMDMVRRAHACANAAAFLDPTPRLASNHFRFRGCRGPI